MLGEPMEPDIMPLHPTSPPPLDDDSDGEAVSEEDEFGDFGGFSQGVSCTPLGFAGSPSSLRQPSPTIKPATHQLDSSFKHPVKQSQPSSAVNAGSSGRQTDMDYNAESCVRLTNGYRNSGTHIAPGVGVCSPREETGFADFTVFTEQATHPWCCGFTPLGSTEQWDGEAVGTNSSNRSGEQICDPGQDVIMDSVPRPHCAYKAKGQVCTTTQHCETRDAALKLPYQDHHLPQEAAAALDFQSEEEESSKPGGSQTTEVQLNEESEEHREDQEISISSVPQTFGVYESASEDLAPFCECPSADLEPHFSSPASEDQTDDEEEKLENCIHSDSFVNDSMEHLRQSEKGFQYYDQSTTQETLATSNQSQSGTCTEDNFADFKDCSSEHHRDQGHVQTADAEEQSLGNLPPSDSFADFCSAPTHEDGEASWAEFRDQRTQEGEITWTQFKEQVSNLQIDGGAEELQDRGGQSDVYRRNSCQGSLSGRVQQLLLVSFPEVELPVVEVEEEEEEEVVSLSALLHARRLPENEQEEEAPGDHPRPQCIQLGMLGPNRDLHSAVGLQFQWGGSHTNRTLLRCLGVDTTNIVFIGMKKQPVAVPAFASSLGMLEPTKDSVPAVSCPGHTAVATQAPPGSPVTQAPSTGSVQEALPSNQLDWSSRGLSSSQDDCTALNLDYFGPKEESKSFSSSSSSRNNSPPPGVDPELYELTISKVETSANSSIVEDTLNRLLSTAEKTSTSVRKPQQDEELSAEAGRVLSGLPNLSFMQAKVLMFPSILIPDDKNTDV